MAEANSPLHEWTAFAARVVKQIAPHQLISPGSDGFYSAINSGGVGAATAKNPRPDHDPSWFVHEGGQFVGDGALDAIDVLSFHMQ